MHLLASDSSEGVRQSTFPRMESDKILFLGKCQKYECTCLQQLLLLQSLNSQKVRSKTWKEWSSPHPYYVLYYLTFEEHECTCPQELL